MHSVLERRKSRQIFGLLNVSLKLEEPTYSSESVVLSGEFPGEASDQHPQVHLRLEAGVQVVVHREELGKRRSNNSRGGAI